MHIRSGIVVLATTLALLLNSASASQQLETCMHQHVEDEQARPLLGQGAAAPFNFWTNLRSFSWGIFLGVPGNVMHDKVKVCYDDLGSTIYAVTLAYDNYVLYPERTAEQLTGDMSNIFTAVAAAGASCSATA